MVTNPNQRCLLAALSTVTLLLEKKGCTGTWRGSRGLPWGCPTPPLPGHPDCGPRIPAPISHLGLRSAGQGIEGATSAELGSFGWAKLQILLGPFLPLPDAPTLTQL